MSEAHEIHDFVVSSQRDIEAEYARIQKRALEDPGTAGDQGEENWATLLRSWLSSYFHIVTKGRILTESGFASPQVDVLVLTPSYPQILLDKKLYLAGGVAAAFECKTTLIAEHVRSAVETCSLLKSNLQVRMGSPYKELNSTIVYGLLAHSHSWKGERSTPIENIEKALWEADSEFVSHPIQCIDFLCVADLATWTVFKANYRNAKQFKEDEMARLYAGYASSGYVCHGIGQARQENHFSPLGVLLAGLFSKFSWTFSDMRNLDAYFRNVNMFGSGQGKSRKWDISIYSTNTKERLMNEDLSENAFDEWRIWF
jgi:hypothetical protein